MAKVARHTRVKLTPGMVFAIPRPGGEYYLIIHLASNRFGEAFGLTAGWQSDISQTQDLWPHPYQAYVYTGSTLITFGKWQYVGDRPDLLASYPSEPEIYHSKMDNQNNPVIGPYGAAETACGRIRCLNEDEYFASPLVNSDFRQIVLEEQVEESLSRWEKL
ncbi:hypothetical protein BH11PLA2_BH11PLA2_37720 [soil metagenome]